MKYQDHPLLEIYSLLFLLLILENYLCTSIQMRDILAGEFSRVLTTVVIYLVRSAWNFHMLYQTLCIIFKTSVTKFVILNDYFYIHC